MSADLARDGWEALGPLLDAAEVRELRDGLDTMVDRAVTQARYPDRETCLRVVQMWPAAWAASAAYAALMRRDDLHRRLRAWLGCDELRLFTQHLVVKPPGMTLVVPWHQDVAVWPAADARGLTFWFALDDVDAASGAIRYLPGSHLVPEPPMDVEPVLVEARAGDALVHTGLTWHTTLPNRSDRWRRACVLAIGDARTPARAGAWDERRNPVL